MTSRPGGTLAIVTLLMVFAWMAIRTAPVRSHEAVKTSVSYDREISRIVARRCVNCHSDGNLAFPLTSYEEVRPWAHAIKEEVLRRHMPPWRAVAGYGTFINDGALTTREHETLISWIEGNGPKTPGQILVVDIGGSANEAERLRPDFRRWQIGQPDTTYPVTAAGPRNGATLRAVATLSNDTPLQVTRLEFRPTTRGALRAAAFYEEASGRWLASWTPWYPGISLPSGSAFHLPPRTRIVAELTMTSDAPIEDVLGDLGVSIAADPRSAAGEITLTTAATARPGTPSPALHAVHALTRETTIAAIVPEMNNSVRALEIRAELPDRTVRHVLLLRDILHEWPTPYIPGEPVRLPAGTSIHVTGYTAPDDPAAAAAKLAVRLTVLSGDEHRQ